MPLRTSRSFDLDESKAAGLDPNARHAGGPMTGNRGGPMTVAKLGSSRSHDRGERQNAGEMFSPMSRMISFGTYPGDGTAVK
jgi:hypothetical protein